jgi:uncharacterized membrane protein HdeD (DUF308 family)
VQSRAAAIDWGLLVHYERGTVSAMQVQVEKTRPDGRGVYWRLPLLRAVPALAAGLAITFLQDHSAPVGLLAFGGFALVSGVLISVLTLRAVVDRSIRSVFLVQGVVAAVCGAVAFAVSAGATVTETGLSEFLLLVTVFAAATGFLELYAGLRAKGTVIGRDWVSVGGATAVVAIVFLVIPPDSVLAVGLFGAYGILLGVYLVIAAFSLKWGTQAAKPAGLESPNHPEPSRGVTP